jgi:restriction system protein
VRIIAIPLQKSIELPLLKVIADGGGSLRMKEATEKVEKYFPKLTNEDKASRLESGGNRWINRVQWVRQHLLNKRELDSPEYGIWQITAKGKSRLNKEFSEWKAEYSQIDFTESPSERITIASREPIGSPREELEITYNFLLESVKEDMLKHVQGISPPLFESLVAELLGKLGYGNVKVTGRSGDGGVDGECCLDPLGLHKVLFQAKRWTHSVGSEVVRNFVGALVSNRVERGILVSTSYFSDAAKKEAIKSGSVKLIDGKELASLMIRCGLGVRKHRLDVPIIDEDYFSGLM